MIHPTVYIHPTALLEKDIKIGANTKIWAFAHLLSDVTIGQDCNLCDHILIENGVSVGNRVTIKSGVFIWSGTEIEDDVFLGPCVALTNDKKPRSKQYSTIFLPIRLLQGCSIGANATILPGITIGRWAMIGAGSVVTRDVPDHALVMGNPARIRGWVCICGEKIERSINMKCIHCE